MTYALVLLNGKGLGTSIPLDPEAPPVTMGRHSSRHLPIDDHRASRLHARIWHSTGRWYLEDCDSLNGTLVNSQPVEQTSLEPGDLIRIGQRLILFAESGEGSGSGAQAFALQTTAMAGTEAAEAAESAGAIVEQNPNEAMSRALRESAVLCRFATGLHEQTDSEQAMQLAISTLVDGIDADIVSIWLTGADGRLRCAARWPASNESEHDPHVLASLAVEKEKALLVERPEVVHEDEENPLGPALGVPIPGRMVCRGAIECHRGPGRKTFTRGELDVAVVISHHFGLVLENLEHRESLEQANDQLRQRVANETKIVGSSPATVAVLDRVARVGPTGATVLVCGESGTGKELVAHAIHELSRHSAGPYVAVNCAAFSDALLESELFGHEPGAFTGADRRHIGQFERSHRGTIFLDEVAEMSLACQAKLLRVLEGHPFQRLGGEDSIRVDVRIVAATHRELPKLVEDGRFREDLFYRLRVIEIRLPALRERGDDVLELASLFLDRYCDRLGRGRRQLSATAIEAIRHHRWPGNIRELKNAIERAVVLGTDELISPIDLGLSAEDDSRESPTVDDEFSLKEAEARHIQYVMQQVDGNKTKACRMLGIGRGTLYKKLEELSD